MKRTVPSAELTQARGWALRLNSLVERALAAQPGADPDSVRHKLIKLGQVKVASPRSLRRDRTSTKNKSADSHHGTRARARRRKKS